MEDADDEINFNESSYAPPPWISLTPFPSQVPPSPRRLSSNFTPPTQPIRAAKQIAWVSLQGRIVGADESSSSKAIGGGLNPDEAIAWDLFSPMHRFLIVAVIAVAAANSKKNKQIIQLTKSVEIRDKVLLGMQQKLENLCEQVNYFKDQPDISAYNLKFSDCGCLCDHHQLPSEPIKADKDCTVKAVDDEDLIKCKIPTQIDMEPEERRMSDLSDWAPSVSSTVDAQWNTASIEQEYGNSREEFEDKDALIKELSTFINTTESVGLKRISELEDIIRHKNMIITKLRKDMVVLEQKVIQLTRLRRSSSTTKTSLSSKKLPAMTDNLVYDMDSTTSPSSSDSDSSTKKKRVFMVKNEDQIVHVKTENVKSDRSCSGGKQKKEQTRRSCDKSTQRPPRPVSPLKEKSMNQQIQPLSGSGDLKSRRSGINKSRVSGSHKRWV